MIIKYISNYRDGTGWSKAGINNMLALDNAGVKVIPSLVRYQDRNDLNSIPYRIEELEKENAGINKYDVVIQHVLPINYTYESNDIKQIGFFEMETLSLENTFWIKKIKLMDSVGVANRISRISLSKYNIKTSILPHFFDFDSVFNSKQVVNIQELNNSFNFLFVGEMIKRKNIEVLLQAFHSEFENHENVNLVIKTNNPSVNNFCLDVKKRLKLKLKYKNEIIITQRLTDEKLYSVMRQCHVGIMPSYGEAWSYGIIEGMTLGLPAIYTDGIGIEDYCNDSCGFAVKSRDVNCYAATDTFKDLYTGKDTWKEIDLIDLRYKMRNIFEMYKNNPTQYIEMQKSSIDGAAKFDYKRSNEYVNKFLEEIK
jgi:glycosyltransferase involved in cell wall biosynthesis